MTKPLHWLTAVEIAAGYRDGSLSPVTLVDALLARVDELNSKVNAFIAIDRDGARAAARQCEAEFAKGAFRSALHGVPIGIKDSIDVAGQITSCHSRMMKDSGPVRTDAPVVAQLRSAGAIMLGKVALHEFGFGGPTFDGPFPPARNPWNLDHHPAGSSSGSGAAIGAGFVPLTLGTDTAGSIRNPGGICGGIGLKPTNELVSVEGVFPLAYTLDQVGPLARSAEDIAICLDFMVDRMRPRAGGLGSTAGGYAADIKRGLKGMRIGFVRHFHERDIAADPEVTEALDKAVEVFRREGASVVDVELRPLREMQAVTGVIWLSEAWAIHKHWLRTCPQLYTQATRRKVMAGAFLTAGDYVKALQGRVLMSDVVNTAFRDVDVLLTGSSFECQRRTDFPATAGVIFPHG